MSQIATFKLYEASGLRELCEEFEENPDEALRKCRQIENDPVLELSNGFCSGEVFTALFDYFEAEVEIDPRYNEEFDALLTFWQKRTGHLDMAIFSPEMAEKIVAVFDGDEFNEEVDIPQIAKECELEAETVLAGMEALCYNLSQVDEQQCLLYFLS